MARSRSAGSVHISITGNSADFRKAVKSARSEIFKLKRALAPIGGIAKSAGIALAAFGASGAVMGKRLADGIDNLGKLSTSLRSSVKDLQAFEIAAGLQGVDFTKATNGLKKLGVITGEISSGAAYSEVTDEWDKLGLKIEEVVNLPVTEQFKRITAAIREQIPEAEHLATASAFFGTRNAADVMRITAETTEQATRILRDYGIELTDARTKGVEAMNDAMLVLQHIFKNFARNIVADYAPAVKTWVQQIQAGLKPGGELRVRLEALAEGFRVAAQAVVNFVDIMSSVITKETVMTAAFAAVAIAVLKIGSAAVTAGVGLGKFGAAMLATNSAAGALGLVLGLGTGGLGAVLMTLFGAGALVAGGVALFQSLTTETDNLAEATDRLTVAKLKTLEAEIKAQIEMARSAKRLQELSNSAGVMGAGHAAAQQKREVADLEKRLAETRGLIRQTSREAPGVAAATGAAATAGGGPKAAEDLSAFGGLHPGWTQGAGATSGIAAPGIAAFGGEGELFDPMARSITHLKDESQSLKNELSAFGGDGELFDPATRSITKFRDEQERVKAQTKQIGDGIKSSIGSSLDGIIDGANDLGDLFDSLLKDLAKMALRMAVFGAPTGVGSGGGIFGSIFGFSSGGMHRGGARIVGENGPELEVTGPSRIYSASATRRMFAGHGTSIQMSVEAVNSGALRDALNREFDRIAPQIVEMSKQAMVSDLRRPSPANSAVRRI